MNNEMKKVSVIIPAYSVENYIAQCLESVCMQSYPELEIIIVYDRCKDKTLEICQEWERRDSRIRLVINEERCGLGEARNIGLRLAEGAYVMYLDSDDWYAPECVEKLLAAAEETGADYVSYSGIYWNQGDKTRLRCRLPAGEYSTGIRKEMVLLQEYPAVWKKIYKRQWLVENQLFQPRVFHYEDWGYNMPLVLSASRIVLIPGAGVYYRVDREGSLSMDLNLRLIEDFGKVLRGGMEDAVKRGIFQQHKRVFLMYFFHDFFMMKKKCLGQQDQEALELLEKIRKDIVEDLLGYKNLVSFKRHMVFGSFSGRWTLEATGIFSENLEHYGFSSLIAAMTPAKSKEVHHESSFRKMQVEQDMSGKFAKELGSLDERTLLVLDFMEERNSVYQDDDGNFYTASEAYQESSVQGLKPGKPVSFGTDRFRELWRQKNQEFVKLLKQKQDILDIILLKNRLSMQYGSLNHTETFDDIREIEDTNQRISFLEGMFLEACKENGIHVTVTDPPEEYQFTDEAFEYGCLPQYTNKLLFACMGMEIVSKYL